MPQQGRVMLVYDNIGYIVDIQELFSKLDLLGCSCETDADLAKFRHETEQLLDSGALEVQDWMVIEHKKIEPPEPKVGHFCDRFMKRRR